MNGKHLVNGTALQITIRPARPDDAAALTPLVFSSGPLAFDYVFSPREQGGTCKFLEFALAREEGVFSYRQHHVAEQNGRIVGSLMLHGGMDNNMLAMGNVKTIIRCFGALGCVPVMMRGLRMESMLKPPPVDCAYLGHLGVDATLRGHGIGARLLEYATSWSRDEGYQKLVLDVAVTNVRAEALYQRRGYQRIEHRPFPHRRPDMPQVPDHYRMVRFIEGVKVSPRALSNR
jgi:ribosomal protein S18 acetylase RimI-like enzyme